MLDGYEKISKVKKEIHNFTNIHAEVMIKTRKAESKSWNFACINLSILCIKIKREKSDIVCFNAYINNRKKM